MLKQPSDHHHCVASFYRRKPQGSPLVLPDAIPEIGRLVVGPHLPISSYTLALVGAHRSHGPLWELLRSLVSDEICPVRETVSHKERGHRDIWTVFKTPYWLMISWGTILPFTYTIWTYNHSRTGNPSLNHYKWHDHYNLPFTSPLDTSIIYKW